MTSKALQKLALVIDLPSTGAKTGTVDIETMWGWHYLIETDEGKRTRLLYRVSIDGKTAQHYPSEFDLPAEAQQSFRPTLEDLNIR